MLKSCVLKNAKVVGFPDYQQIEINAQGIITVITPQSVSLQPNECDRCYDLGGDWLSLGGMDLQINGGLGLSFSELTHADLPLLQRVCEFLWSQGVDSFCPTIITSSLTNIRRSLSVIRQYCNQPISNHNAAQILGVHLEGPFLNVEKQGAHPSQHLLDLTLENVKLVLGDDADLIKIMTLAPELDDTGETISYLTDLGIIVSLGHSQATEEQAKQAFEQGASMVTHAFNAMPPLHHRHPGLLAAAILNPRVYCGLIPDGQHVSPSMIDILLRASQYDQGIFLVSDALAPLGLAPGMYSWDDRQMEIKNGTARLTDGTLSGTTLPLLAGVNNLVNWQLCSPGTAIALATHAPRRALGESSLAIHQRADNLLGWHYDSERKTLQWQRLENLFS